MAREREKLLIIDGYNVLRSGSRYKRMLNPEFPDYTDDTFNAARERLINDVVAYAGYTYHAIIVFDGGNNAFSDGSSEFIGGIEIIFSPTGQAADKVIEKLAHDARERMTETLVVTGDADIQDTVFGGGITRMSAEGFSREIEMSYAEAREDRQPEVAVKNTVSDRIDIETLRKLEDLRDK